jgi:uncharacterized membrane protein
MEEDLDKGGAVATADRQHYALQTIFSFFLGLMVLAFIGVATLVMSVSLVRSDQLRALSNGLLLGGLFTMVYGMGWTIASGTSNARFFVALFALAITIVLGDHASRCAVVSSTTPVAQ